MNKNENYFKTLSQAIQDGLDEDVPKYTQEALDNNIALEEILNKGLIGGMNVVGKKFKEHQIFLPEVLLAARAMHAGMDVLKPLLIKNKISSKGKILIGTVQGDLHDIGKNLVAIMLEGAGFDVIDLGTDVSAQTFIDSAKKENASVIGMSALLTTTMPAMKEVIDTIKKEGLNIKTIVGGAPVSENYARSIGADAFGFDASFAVEKVSGLIG